MLSPLAVFFTYKANNDSVVFNIDMYRNLLMRLLGLRLKRHVSFKDVIIETPRYDHDVEVLERISAEISEYSRSHNLLFAPNVVNVFFRYSPDNSIAVISEELEEVIEDLSNTRDPKILTELSHYPFMAVKAHTRPFERKWLNIVAALVVPVGIFLYIRMWRFRLRLYRDLRAVRHSNSVIVRRIRQMKFEGLRR